MEFISSLDFDDDNVSFRMFNKPLTLTWKTVSVALGFSDQCVVNIADVLKDFNKDHFWENITAKQLERKQKYTTEEDHHPTLRFMLKCLAFTFFPREELNTIKEDELHLLYIMIKKRKALLGILNVTTKSRLSFLILITAPKMPNLSLMPLKPSCHPQHDMRDAVLKYAIALLNK